jgi:molybdopterin converting factor small subunit
MKLEYSGWLVNIMNKECEEAPFSKMEDIFRYIEEKSNGQSIEFSGDLIENLCFALNKKIIQVSELPEELDSEDVLSIFPPLTGG